MMNNMPPPLPTPGGMPPLPNSGYNPNAGYGAAPAAAAPAPYGSYPTPGYGGAPAPAPGYGGGAYGGQQYPPASAGPVYGGSGMVPGMSGAAPAPYPAPTVGGQPMYGQQQQQQQPVYGGSGMVPGMSGGPVYGGSGMVPGMGSAAPQAYPNPNQPVYGGSGMVPGMGMPMSNPYAPPPPLPGAPVSIPGQQPIYGGQGMVPMGAPMSAPSAQGMVPMSSTARAPAPVASPMSNKRRIDLLFKDVLATQIFTPLLKFNKSGKPTPVYVGVSIDLGTLTFFEKGHQHEAFNLALGAVHTVLFGQRTDTFRRNNRPDLESLSFSLILDERGDETLDLVSKDEKEFQTWTRSLTQLCDKNEPAVLEELRILSKNKKDRPQPYLVGERDAMKAANDVYAWGWGEWGQNGFGAEVQNCSAPKLVETMLGRGIINMACGWAHTTALTDDGVVLQYGNKVGTSLDDSWLPIALQTINERTSVVQVACGSYHTAALTSFGTVMTWGCNLFGQLGHGDCRDTKEPRVVAYFANPENEITIEYIACGANFTAAIATEECKVYTWGCGDKGALGHQDKTNQLMPKLVQDLVGTDVKKLVCGDFHVFALTDQETYAWGWNGCGQLGINSLQDQSRPHSVDALRGHVVVSLACGASHTLASLDHVLYSWGNNAVGQIGQGKLKKVLLPTVVPSVGKRNRVMQVAAGAVHSLFRTENNEVWSAGSNKYGQLGHSANIDFVDEFKPVEGVPAPKTISWIGGGGQNSVLLTARAWVEDSEIKECVACHSVFTFINRKQQCRNCGGIFCTSCTGKRTAIAKLGLTEPVRVCDNCFMKLAGH